MSDAVLIYDGDCPFCANYVEFMRLRETFPTLQLVSARDDPEHAAIALAYSRGLSLDEGMVLIAANRIYHGSAAIHRLADHAPPTLFGRLNRWIFRSPARTSLIYPLLRAGRNATLRVLGRSKIDQHHSKP